MARIKTTDGTIHNKSFAKQVVGWEQKGSDVSDARDAWEMAEYAGLNWAIELQDVRTENGTPTPWRMAVKIDSEGTQTPLSVVPDKNWSVLGNIDFCDRALKIARNFGGTVARAGWVMKETAAVGQKSFNWAMVKPGMGIAKDCALDTSEGIQPIIFLTSGTCYGLGYHCRMMFLRSICQNGMINLQNTGIRTTHQTEGAFENFTLEQVRESVKVYMEEKDLLINTEISEKASYAWFLENYGKASAMHQPIEYHPKKMQQLWDIYCGNCDNIFAEAGINLAQSKIKGSYYGILQALIAYNNHFGESDSNATMIDILHAEKGKEMQKVRETLALAARKRQIDSSRVGVAVRAW